MANTIVSFKKGLLANLPATKAAGTFYVTTDERAMYLDVDASTRIRLGDFQEFATVEALTANPNPSTTALYYVSGINCLAKWNGSEYIQINKDTGATSIEVVGDGNAVTAAVYDATGRKLTLTKGATYMTAADVDGKISDKVGAIEGTVKAYVDDKTSGIASAAALTALTGRVDTLEDKVDVDLVSTAISDSVTAAKTAVLGQADYTGTVKGAYEAAAAAQATANTKTTMAEVAAKNYATKTEAKAYADAKDAAIAAAKAAADAAQSDVDALEGKVGTVAGGKTVVGLIGTAQAAADAAQADADALEAKVGEVPADKTVVKMIEEAQAAATYDDTQVKADIKANADAITVLNGTGEGSVSKQVADAVAQIVADAPEAYDTLKEISDWISSHASDAAAMNSQITTNKTNIADLTALVGTLPETATSDTVVGYIDEAIAALKIGDYAKAADLTAAVARIGTAEGKITTLEGQVAIINGDASTAGSIAKAAADTLASAKTYADGLNTAMDTRVQAVEGKAHEHANKALLDTYTQTEADLADAVAKKHEHTNKTVLDGITAKKVSAWDSAEANAKSYTDALADGQVATNKTNIENLQSGKADKATTLSGYGIVDAYTKAEIENMLSWSEF